MGQSLSFLWPNFKRVADDNFPLEGPALKKRRVDLVAADNENLEVNEEIKLNSSLSKNGSTAKSIDDLPPEMLVEILQHVTTGDLVRSRQVNDKWYEVSSRILRHQEDMVLRFRFSGGHFVVGRKAKRLKELMDCFKESQLPCTHFSFEDLSHFGNEDINSFFSIWKKQILCLQITLRYRKKLAETLRHLLLEQVPNLRKLVIHSLLFEVESVPFRLYEFQLHNLEVVVISDPFCRLRRLTENILKAACNLQQLILERYITADDLIMLQSLNKLHCLKKISICLSEDLILYWLKSSNRIRLTLESLHVRFGKSLKNEQLKLGATSMANHILESSKDMIKTLNMAPTGLLPGIIFPKLSKMHTLHLSSYPDSPERTLFFPVTNRADIFPNLRELHLENVWIDDAFPPSQSLKPIPSIEILHFYEKVRGSPESHEKLMKMTPNVKSFHLNEYRYREWPKWNGNGFRAAVDTLTKLEKLEWIINSSTHRALQFSLDAAITGLPEQFCQIMSVKYRNKNNLSTNDVAAIESKRKNSSILNLKDLKKLHIVFNFDSQSTKYYEGVDEAGYGMAHKFYKTGLTKVSEFLAFRLMPNLEIQISNAIF